MSDIVLDNQLFADFCKHLSASINVVDVLDKLDHLESPGFDSERDDPIKLIVDDQKTITRLKELRYPEFIQDCVRNLRFTKNCADVFLSEVESATFEAFGRSLEHFAPQAHVEITDEGFVIHSAALIADLILPPIGRVHHELLHSFKDFCEMLELLDNDPTRLFLNAKSPTPESQYIQFWIASKLKIPLAPTASLVAVV